MLRRGLGVFANLVIVHGLAVGGNVLASRLMGPTQRGAFLVAALGASITVSLSDFGLRSALLYNLSRIEDVGRAVREGVAVSSRLLAAAGLVAGIVYLAGYSLGRETFLRGVSPGVALGSFALCLAWLFQDVLGFFFQGLRDYRGRNLMATLPPLIALCGLAILWRAGAGLGAAGMMKLQIAATAPAVVVGLVYLVRRHRPGTDLRPPADWKRRYIPYGLKSALAQGLVTMNLRLDALILNSLLGNRDVGLYSAGVAAAEVIQHVPNAITVVLFPELGAMRGPERLRAVLLALGASLYLVLVGGLILGLLMPWLLPLAFGAAFAPAVSAATWLLPGMAGLAALRVLGTATSAHGRPEYRSYAAAVGLAANVGLDLALIPRYGIVGASWAASITYAISAFGLLILYARLIGSTPARLLAGAAVEPVRWARARIAASWPSKIPAHAVDGKGMRRCS